MTRRMMVAALALLLTPALVQGITEKKTGTTYPDAITVAVQGVDVPMHVTGVGLREKTFLKVDVYTIVSYVADGADLGSDDQGLALASLQQPRRLQMDLRRGFSREKLINAFVEVIEKNYEDMSAFAEDMETFNAYWTRDAQDGDKIIFDYAPGTGLRTNLNGEDLGTIDNGAFAEALWAVWFGKKPANGGLKKDLLSALDK